jgi:hypothetical protein
MPRDRADSGLAQTAYQQSGVLSWVHTINSEEETEKYKSLGVASIYTDWSPEPRGADDVRPESNRRRNDGGN